jgi:hypothetical protein
VRNDQNMVGGREAAAGYNSLVTSVFGAVWSDKSAAQASPYHSLSPRFEPSRASLPKNEFYVNNRSDPQSAQFRFQENFTRDRPPSNPMSPERGLLLALLVGNRPAASASGTYSPTPRTLRCAPGAYTHNRTDS